MTTITNTSVTTSGKILYSNLYNNVADLPSASTYHGMFAHVHSTGAGYFAHGGAWLKLVHEDTNGYVTIPSQPRFYSKNMNFPNSTAGYGVGGTVDVNNGSVYDSSNGRFTAPVAGTYIFHMMTQYYNGSTGSYVTGKFYKNDVFQAIEAYQGNATANHAQANLMQMMTLSSGDYVNAHTDFGARDIQNFFSGYLIG